MQKKILVIDDEETVLTMAKSALEKNYNVTTVNSAITALKLFMEGYAPHLILLDLYMPEMSGWDALIRIRNFSKLFKTRIVIYSTSEDQKDKEKAKELGAVDFIHKPINAADLLEKITQLLT